MLKRQKRYHQSSAQSAYEYTVVLATVLAIITVMSPLIQRSSQAWTKLIADRVGVQNLADQQFDDINQGHLQGTNTFIQTFSDDETIEIPSQIWYTQLHNVFTTTDTAIDLGVTPSPH